MVKTYQLDDQQRTRRCVGHAQSDDFKVGVKQKRSRFQVKKKMK
jgi:hypothetical protein